MAYKQPSKGKAKRKALAKQQSRKTQTLSQQKFNQLVVNLAKTADQITLAEQVLVLAPKIFNVGPMIKAGEIDRSRLDEAKLLDCGKKIIANHVVLEKPATIVEPIRNFIVNEVPDIVVGKMSPLKQVELQSRILEFMETCEIWQINFNNNIHLPLIEAVSTLNDAMIDSSVDVTESLRVVRTISELTKPTEEGVQ